MGTRRRECLELESKQFWGHRRTVPSARGDGGRLREEMGTGSCGKGEGKGQPWEETGGKLHERRRGG
jgi:hypothetical protein